MRFSYFHLLQPGGRLYSLIEIKAIKEVDVASITEQLSTGDFIKRGPDYVLFHKTNEGEITNFLGCSQIHRGPHDIQTQLLAVEFTYRTGPFFHSYGVYRHYLTAGGRFPLEIGEVKSQGASQRTTRTLTGFIHHSCGARLINRCIVR